MFQAMLIVYWPSNFMIKSNESGSVTEAVVQERDGIALHACRVKFANQVRNDNSVKRAFCVQEEKIYGLLEVMLGVLNGLREK